MNRLTKRLRALFNRRALDRDLEDELRFHLEMKAAETGDPLEARHRFGSVSALKEVCREMWTFTALETWWRDIRYGLRTLGGNPSFVFIAVLALALGIGANTTVFTVVSRALSFDLGVEHVERIVFITTSDRSHRTEFFHSFLDLRDLLSQIKSITDLAAYRFLPVNVSDQSGLPERYYCVQMSAGGFAIIGRKPSLGRSFISDDMRPNATPVILVSHRIWQNRYGKDPAILGRTIRVNDVARLVTGVMPAGMQFPEDTDFWIPLTPTDLITMRDPNLLVFGRLADGVKLTAARSEIDTIARRLANKSPDKFKELIADVQPILVMYGVYDSRPLLIAMLFAVAFVLLIACADVANMLLSRAASRAREISIRIAIGAGRARIIRQLLIESVILSIISGVFGWVVAFAGLRWFDGMTAKGPRPSWVDFSINTTVFVYLAAISIGAGILFGLAPALQLAKVDVNTAVKDGGHGAAGGLRGRRLSSLLVVFEMALSVVLLAGAGLMIRSSLNLYSSPIGVDASNVLTMHINLPEAKYPHNENQISFHARLKSQLEALPGVEVASLTSNLPGSGWMDFPCELEGAPPADASHAMTMGGLVVAPGYFQVMRIRPRRGRLFTDSDGLAGPPVALVNESFAAKFWPEEDPLGKRMRLTGGRTPRSWVTVAGVIPDIQQNFRRPAQRDPLIYLPYTAAPERVMYIVARTRVPPATLAEAFRREIQNLDENLPAYDVRTLEDRIAQNRLNVTSFGALFTLFAAVALVLASVGLYGVIAHSVSVRTQEIGIRVAMGGQARDILALVVGQGMRQVAIGLVAGIPIALALTRVLSRALVGVSPGDPLTFVSVVLVLTLAGLLGCVIPARRAIRVDPVVALRSE